MKYAILPQNGQKKKVSFSVLHDIRSWSMISTNADPDPNGEENITFLPEGTHRQSWGMWVMVCSFKGERVFTEIRGVVVIFLPSFLRNKWDNKEDIESHGTSSSSYTLHTHSYKLGMRYTSRNCTIIVTMSGHCRPWMNANEEDKQLYVFI